MPIYHESAEDVFAGLAPWVTAPREALKHLPSVTLSPSRATSRW